MGFVVDRMLLGQVFLREFLYFPVSNISLLLSAALFIFVLSLSERKKAEAWETLNKTLLARKNGQEISLIFLSPQRLVRYLLFSSDVLISVLFGSSQLFTLQIVSSRWGIFLSSHCVLQEYRNSRNFYCNSSEIDREMHILLHKE